MSTVTATGHRKASTYTDDRGNVYRFGVKAAYVPPATARYGLGGGTAGTSVPRLPQGFRMRTVLARENLGTRTRWIPCYTNTCAAWTTGGPVTRDINGTDVLFNILPGHHRQEVRPRDHTRQTT